VAVNYTSLQVQFGALLRIARKIEARMIHARQADNANYDRRLLVAANGFATTDTDEAKALAHYTSWLDDTEVAILRDRFVSFRSAIEDKDSGLGMILKNDLLASAEDIAAPWIRYKYDNTLTDGTIAILRREGIFGALRRDMELAAISQYVVTNVVTFGALTALSGNLGLLTATSASAESHCPSGTLVIECVSETVHRCEMKLQIELGTAMLPDGTSLIFGDNVLRAEKSWQDGPTGITCVLTRSGLASPTTVVDEGGCFSAETFATPHGSDCDLGNYYVRTTRQAAAPIWLIEFFADSARTRKVGRHTEAAGAGNVAISVTLSNGTVFTANFERTAAGVEMPATGDTADAQWDIETPRLGDKWTRSLTNDYAGVFATKILKLWRASLPIAGANLWTDANAADVSMS